MSKVYILTYRKQCSQNAMNVINDVIISALLKSLLLEVVRSASGVGSSSAIHR